MRRERRKRIYGKQFLPPARVPTHLPCHRYRSTSIVRRRRRVVHHERTSKEVSMTMAGPVNMSVSVSWSMSMSSRVPVWIRSSTTWPGPQRAPNRRCPRRRSSKTYSADQTTRVDVRIEPNAKRRCWYRWRHAPRRNAPRSWPMSRLSMSMQPISSRTSKRTHTDIPSSTHGRTSAHAPPRSSARCCCPSSSRRFRHELVVVCCKC